MSGEIFQAIWRPELNYFLVAQIEAERHFYAAITGRRKSHLIETYVFRLN